MKSFFDVKEEKITEKAFSHGLLMSVLSIFICIIALCSITYAWFSVETETQSNTLVSGSFDLDVSVSATQDGGVATVEEVTVTEAEDGTWCCTLDGAGKTYTVTLVMTPESTVKGYCGISVNGGEERLTKPLSNDPAIGAPTLSFTFTTTEENTTLIFTPKWGYPAESSVPDENGALAVETETLPEEA